MVTPIKHAPRATLSAIGRAILAKQPERPWDVAEYLTELYRLGVKVGYDPLAMIAQCCYETADAASGRPFASDLWTKYLNPAGIGQTDGGPQDRLETDDPRIAARAYITHLGGYIEGPDGGWLANTIYKRLDPRWSALGPATFGSVANVEDLGGGLWATQAKATYSAGILRWMRACGWQDDTVTPPVTAPPSAPPAADVTLPYILITAGHRATGAGGEADSNPTEAFLTQFLAADYETAFLAAGYQCDWFQRTLDGDDLPTETRGTLDTVALGCGRVLRSRTDELSILLDCHYNGPHSPLHVIVPDTVGLHTAYANGAPPDDTAANNVWDVDLAGRIADALHAALGEPLVQTAHGPRPGIMSERDCGVALQYSARLAMFAATADSRQSAIRLVIEHGGYADEAAQRDDFTQRCAPAVVGAVNDFARQTMAASKAGQTS